MNNRIIRLKSEFRPLIDGSEFSGCRANVVGEWSDDFFGFSLFHYVCGPTWSSGYDEDGSEEATNLN